MIPTEDVPGHIIETIDVTTGVPHDTLTPVLITLTVTLHTTDCLHTEAHNLLSGPEQITILFSITNQVREPCINLQHSPADLKTNCMIQEIRNTQ